MSDLLPTREPVEVVSGLFLGSCLSAHNLDVLQQHGITHVVNCAVEIDNKFPERIVYASLLLDDDPEQPLDAGVRQGLDFLHTHLAAGRRVLVHCQAGISRSVSLVLYYLMKHQQMRLRDAFLLVKQKRPAAQPNCGFFRQLSAYEVELFGSASYDHRQYIKACLLEMGVEESRAEDILTRYAGCRDDIIISAAFS